MKELSFDESQFPFNQIKCVCVCTVLGHERRGSLPSTCCRNFTCQVTRQFSAGGQSCEHSWSPNEEGYATADVESDQLHVPASWPPEAARLEKSWPPEAARLDLR